MLDLPLTKKKRKEKKKPCGVKLHLLLVAGNQQVLANQPWLIFLEL